MNFQKNTQSLRFNSENKIEPSVVLPISTFPIPELKTSNQEKLKNRELKSVNNQHIKTKVSCFYTHKKIILSAIITLIGTLICILISFLILCFILHLWQSKTSLNENNLATKSINTDFLSNTLTTTLQSIVAEVPIVIKQPETTTTTSIDSTFQSSSTSSTVSTSSTTSSTTVTTTIASILGK